MNPVTGLNIGRVVIGVIALVSPKLAGKLFRLDVASQPQLGYLSRMFGSREIALGALTLAAKGQNRNDLVLVGVAVDGADVVAALGAGVTKSVSKPTMVFLALPAIAAVTVGVLEIRRRS